MAKRPPRGTWAQPAGPAIEPQPGYWNRLGDELLETDGVAPLPVQPGRPGTINLPPGPGFVEEWEPPIVRGPNNWGMLSFNGIAPLPVIGAGTTRDITGAVDLNVAGWAAGGVEFTLGAAGTVEARTIRGALINSATIAGGGGGVFALPLITDRVRIFVIAAGLPITSYWWQIYLRSQA